MTTTKFSSQLLIVNQRLKAGKIGVTLQQKGNRLYLRGTLPPRPGSEKTKPYQQEIALGIESTIEGIRTAEKAARQVGGLLAVGDFDWEPYLRHNPISNELRTIADYIQALKADYFMRRSKTPKSLSTWQTNYEEVFSRLPSSELLSKEILISAIKATNPDTRMRQKTCLALAKLVEIANFNFDVKRFSGNYSPTKVSKRELPSDEAIAIWRNKITNPQWQWCFGMLATYGLRPHEVFHLDLEHFPTQAGVLRVMEGKTGERRVWPLHPEWVEYWQLMDVKVPGCIGRNNKELGQRVSQYFRRQGIEFRPYDLRHAWAIRSMEYGLEVSLAAKQMGHSVAIHIQTYHAWLDEHHQQQAFERLLNNPKRPVAPFHQL